MRLLTYLARVGVAAFFLSGSCLAQTVAALRFVGGPDAVAGTPAVLPPAYEVDGPAYLQRLRADYHLDEVVASASTDFERVQRLSRWVRARWEHNGDSQPSKPDPLTILAEARAGDSFRCVEYAEVLAAALSSIGVPARVLELKTRDVETRESGAGHVVAEACLRDQAKWVLVDGQWDVIPMRGSDPLNAVELQQAIAERRPDLTVQSLSGTTTKQYVEWITPYLYYFNTAPRAWTTGVPRGAPKMMLVPLGTPAPTVFQRRFPLRNFAVTHSAATFYAAPGAAGA